MSLYISGPDYLKMFPFILDGDKDQSKNQIR